MAKRRRVLCGSRRAEGATASATKQRAMAAGMTTHALEPRRITVIAQQTSGFHGITTIRALVKAKYFRM